MVCSRCGVEGHRRNNQLCRLFYYAPDRYFRRRGTIRRERAQQVSEAEISEEKRNEHDRKCNKILRTVNTITVMLPRWINAHFYTNGNSPEFRSRMDRITEVCQEVITIIGRSRPYEPYNVDHIDRLNTSFSSQFNFILTEIEFLYDRDFADYIISNTQSQLIRNILSQQTKRVLEVSVSSIVDFTYDHFECGICFDDKEQNTACTFNCLHKFCVDCVCGLVDSRKSTFYRPMPCPMCRVNINRVITNSNEYKTQLETHL